MALYLHIPFCKQACHYCNFHFSTTLRSKPAMVAAIVQELELRRDYLGDEALKSIYFGGGTPSLLDMPELEQIFKKIYDLFDVDGDAEITLEAHTAQHARNCLRDAAAAGFQDLTIDLIYGAPTTTDEAWAENVRIGLAEGIPHLSC